MTIIENETTTSVETSTVDLLAAVKDVNRVTGTRIARNAPVLAHLRLRTVDGALEVSAFNYETSVVKRLPVTGVVESVYVLGAALAAALARLDKGLVSLSVDGKRLNLRQGSKRVELATLADPDNYPEVPATPERFDFAISGANLALIADKLTPFAGNDDMLPVLTGVCLDLLGDTVTAMTTDRFRAAMMPVTVVTNTDAPVTALVPNMGDVGAVFATSERVDVHIDDQRTMHLTSESSSMSVRLLDGSFPRLRGLFPEDPQTAVTFEPLSFIRSVKFASTPVKKNEAIKLSTDGNGITLTGEGHDETMTDVVPATLTGEGVHTGFNPDFLVSAVKVFGKGLVTMGSTSGTKPSVFTSETVPNLRVLLMPRRLLS